MDETTKTTKEPGESRAAIVRQSRFGPEVENHMKEAGVNTFLDLACAHGISGGCLRGRLNAGLNIRQALGLDEPPVRFRRNRFGPEVENYMKEAGVSNLGELADHFGVTRPALKNRLQRGDSIRVALGIARRQSEIATPSRVYPSLMHACRGMGVTVSTVYAYRRENGCTTQEAFDAVLSARRSKRIIKTKQANAKIPMPDPVVFGWRFRSWSAAAEYWGGMKHSKRPQAVIDFVRTQPLVPESIFAAVRHEFDIRGMLDSETGLIKGRPLPKGTTRA